MASIKEQMQYRKVGRLRTPVAAAIERKPADIYINDKQLRHIFHRHEEDLAHFGLTPKVFVDLVVNNFNRIYKGGGRSLLLVLWNGKPKVVAVELNFALKKEFYEVKTASVYRKEFFCNKQQLWAKK